MDVKETLQQPKKIEQMMEKKQMRLEALREMAGKITGVISDMPRAASPNPHRLEGVMAKIVDLEREVAEDKKALTEARKTCAELITLVQDSREIQVLELRYLENKGWKEIMGQMDRSREWVMKIHRTALQEIEQECAEKNFKKIFERWNEICP